MWFEQEEDNGFSWSLPMPVFSKFNADGAARGKPDHAGIAGILCDDKGMVWCIFSKSVGIKESNEAKVLAILEALRVLSWSFQGGVIVESDSSNTISWGKPWKFHFYFDKIKPLAPCLQVVFCHVIRLANGLADALAKQGGW